MPRNAARVSRLTARRGIRNPDVVEEVFGIGGLVALGAVPGVGQEVEKKLINEEELIVSKQFYYLNEN